MNGARCGYPLNGGGYCLGRATEVGGCYRHRGGRIMAKPRMERPARVASMPRAEGPAEVAMREYVCDSCGSPAGMACVTRAGRFARFAHAARYAAAERDGKVGAALLP